MKLRRSDLRPGDVLNRGSAIVVDMAAWWKHPRFRGFEPRDGFREFEPRDGARGFAVACLHVRGWSGPHEDRWRPDVFQVADVVHVARDGVVVWRAFFLGADA